MMMAKITVTTNASELVETFTFDHYKNVGADSPTAISLALLWGEIIAAIKRAEKLECLDRKEVDDETITD